MDLTWKTAAWNWDQPVNSKENKKKGVERIALFRCHAGGQACVVQISRKTGSATPKFDAASHSKVIETEETWNNWLSEIPQPGSNELDAALSVVIFPRHPDTEVSGGTVRNPLNLTHVPLPGGRMFRRLVETFHIHQATQTIMNRGWPIILRSEDFSSPERKIYYNLRCSNTLENDTALTMTVIPSKRLTYAIFFGYTDKQINTVLKRLDFAGHALLEPFTLINAFIQLEKVHRFEQVERHADEMTDLIKNFQFDASTASATRAPDPVPEDDPRDLVGLAAKMTTLRNGLMGWAKEMERFRGKAVEDFGTMVGKDPKLPLLNAGEYLDRTVDEYSAMETSSIARQEVNKMKALAILTMVFLPATFVATFMSMGLFNWHPREDEEVMSPYWWIYFAVAGGLTALVFILEPYFW
ncbi:hypothetical protein B0T25DRAFT_586193 [Lasiosphaeria hispida]|uniref:Uncharacterized protein n=1 Tax=Lasiosphaeria hispida TaxID=260671 RepID=A0AAJ0H874_9PEZI|nr:hypothetical protein B0T25DRAFT_586193 [Lasiosphaeria hispida]